MKKYIAILAAFFCIAYFSFAQDFINHVQKDERGSGSVSVKQSEDISKLVNGGKKEQKQAGQNANTRQENNAQKRNETQTTESKPATGKQEQARERSIERNQGIGTTREEEQRDKVRREKERQQRADARAQMIKEAEQSGEPQSGDKKMMSNSKRVTGYRVQVFAGGNTREDRAKANEVCAKLKTQIPGQPIYVHFYSPRWCCRCGNFLNQEEANKMRQRLSKLGYKNACVVKTIITVSRSTKVKSEI